ncbi:hypothetical protein QBC38DRAFT_479922 [Podospora fimiseda]|uniref:Uncharacterized protein n=1 Tax=Podospora fimiseda TaxID=252190 RepID=A0AAN7GTH6_9PEZI|nr:hypothetical protein QBC38DRAFT_479922 [Podospora fimiseda]
MLFFSLYFRALPICPASHTDHRFPKAQGRTVISGTLGSNAQDPRHKQAKFLGTGEPIAPEQTGGRQQSTCQRSRRPLSCQACRVSSNAQRSGTSSTRPAL